MNARSNAKYVAAIIVGLAYIWLATAFWGRYVMNHPVNEFLLEVFARQGHRFLYGISILVHDVLINILLALPAALAFVSIKSLNNWKCVAVAVGTAFVGSYWTVDPSSIPLLVQSGSFWVGISMSTFSLPVAYLVAKSFRNPARSA